MKLGEKGRQAKRERETQFLRGEVLARNRSKTSPVGDMATERHLGKGG